MTPDTDNAAHRRADAWHNHYTRARAHLADHPDLATADDDLARWGDRQIRALRELRTDDDHRKLLHAAGITERTPTTTEAVFLGELDWWVARHGDALVPQMATTPRIVRGRPYWLGKRVSEARIAHGRGVLSPALEHELPRRAGWAWRTLEARWDASWGSHAAALEQHVAAGGTISTLPSATYKWLMRQRARLNQLPADRIQRLQAVPGALVSRDTRVPDFVDAARTWLAQTPNRTMAALRYADTVSVDDKHVPLGRRATYYRRRFHGLEGTHPLTPAEVTAIEALPGWTWKLQEQHRGRRPASVHSEDSSTAAFRRRKSR
jgi:hypothetical protein